MSVYMVQCTVQERYIGIVRQLTHRRLMMPDKYDDAIDCLTRAPSEIPEAWGEIRRHPAGCLFQLAWNKDAERAWPVGRECPACLTQIRGDDIFCDDRDRWIAQTPELTKAIKADERIPSEPTEIEVSDLPVFAEWQRRLDKELDR